VLELELSEAFQRSQTGDVALDLGSHLGASDRIEGCLGVACH